MTTIVIEDNIPLPARTVERDQKHPAHSLNAGQSYFLEGGDFAKTSAAVRALGKRVGKTFEIRRATKGDGDAAVEGVRVWRTA